MDHPPTVEELVGCKPPVTGLDEGYVVEHFAGKTQAEAIREYQSQGAFLAEDFAYMAAVGLRYYLPPALEYLRSSGDGDFVHGLMCSLHVQVRHRKPLPGDVEGAHETVHKITV